MNMADILIKNFIISTGLGVSNKLYSPNFFKSLVPFLEKNLIIDVTLSHESSK